MITIHGGHNPAGKIACGASDFLDESTEARYIAREVTKILGKNVCKNITVNDGTNQNDILVKLVNKANKHKDAKVHVAVHLNSAGHSKADGKTKGVEVLVYSKGGIAEDVAKKICKKISALGYTNRGVKVRSDLYFLRKTSKPSILIECCFVDDKDDAILWKKNRGEVAKAIAACLKAYV